MTNQLLLAQVLAEGFTWDYLWHWTHDPDAWKTVLPASATVIAAAIAVIGVGLTARKATQQMELSKQGTPPELTRYKEWLEVSEKYKDLVDSTNVHVLVKNSPEYQEIESSRKEALTRAIWERKVLASCSNIRGQKRLLNIPASLVVHGDKEISSLPNFRYGKYLWLEGLFILPVFVGMLLLMLMLTIAYIAWVLSGGEDFIGVTISFAFKVLFCLYALGFGVNLAESTRMGLSGEWFAEYGYLRILQEDLPSDKFNDLFQSSLNKINNSQRCLFALWDENYRNFVYCPKWVESKFASILEPIIFCLPYWIVNIRHKSRGYNYGEYRPEIFGISEENLERKDTQALNSEIQEESQPTPPQG